MKNILYPKQTALYIIGRLEEFRTLIEDIMEIEVSKLNNQQNQLIKLLNTKYGSIEEALVITNKCIARLNAEFEVCDEDFEFLNLVFSLEVK